MRSILFMFAFIGLLHAAIEYPNNEESHEDPTFGGDATFGIPKKVHVQSKPSNELLNNLNPPLKIFKEEVLNEAWAKYRDEQAQQTGTIDVSWIYAIFLLVLTVYAAILIYLPSPDHKVFVQFDCLPEKQVDSEGSNSSSAEIPQKKPDPDGYMPLTRFLASKQ